MEFRHGSGERAESLGDFRYKSRAIGLATRANVGSRLANNWRCLGRESKMRAHKNISTVAADC